jgi:hypothetical protein
MPFSSTENVSETEWTETYEKFFRPIMESFGFTCKRSEVRNRPLTKYIVQDLKNSDLVISDITDSNPNVLWELGVRHSLSRKTIMISSIEMKEKIPSDLKPYGVVFYKKDKTAYEDFKQQISEVLKEMESDLDNNSGPVFDALKTDEFILSSYGRKQIINKLVGLMTEIGENLGLANDIKSGKEPIGDGKGVTPKRFHPEAIDKILIENYVYGGKKYVELLQTIRSAIHSGNYRLEILTTTSSLEQGKQIRSLLISTAEELITLLGMLMTQTKNLYNLVKSNSLKEEEPSVVLTSDLQKQFFG